MTRRWATIFGLVSAAISLALPPGTALVAQPGAVHAASATAAGTSEKGAFPVWVTSGASTVRIAARPTRILCLSASATEMLYAIGAGKQVVGVDKYSAYPPGAPRTKFTGYESSAESYLYLHPDLVILAFKTGTLVQQLAKLHIATIVLPPARTFSDVYAQITELGTATGHSSATKGVVSSLSAHLVAAQRTTKGGRGDTYYIELDPSFYTATSKTFIGAEFSLFGMRDIADAAGHLTAYPQISAEYLLKTNPDYVFLADTVCCRQTATSFGRRPGLSSLRAIKLHHVIGVNDSVASEWGPHTIEAFVSLLASTLRS